MSQQKLNSNSNIPGLSETESSTVKERVANLEQANKLATTTTNKLATTTTNKLATPVSSTTDTTKPPLVVSTPKIVNNSVAALGRQATKDATVSKVSTVSTVPTGSTKPPLTVSKDTTVSTDTTKPPLTVSTDTTDTTKPPLTVSKDTTDTTDTTNVLNKKIADDLKVISTLTDTIIATIQENNDNEKATLNTKLTETKRKFDMSNRNLLESTGTIAKLFTAEKDRLNKLMQNEVAEKDRLNKLMQKKTALAVAAAGKYYKYKQKYLQLKNNTL